VGPAQGAGLLGADPGEQAQHDVGVHERGRAADVLQAGVQFRDGKGAGGGDDGHGLVQGQGSGGAAFLAFGGAGQDGDVAADQVGGFGVPDGALERELPHGHRRGGVPGGHLGQRLPHVGCGQLAELAGADDFQIGSGTFWFLVIFVAERPSSGQQLGRHVGDFVFGHFGPAGSRPR
jgi:hypothetical protein